MCVCVCLLQTHGQHKIHSLRNVKMSLYSVWPQTLVKSKFPGKQKLQRNTTRELPPPRPHSLSSIFPPSLSLVLCLCDLHCQYDVIVGAEAPPTSLADTAIHPNAATCCRPHKWGRADRPESRHAGASAVSLHGS